MDGACSTYGERWCVYRVVVEKLLGRPLERPRRRWEDNIKMDFDEVGWGRGLDRSRSVYGQVVRHCKRGNEPSVSIICGEFLD